jgi:hypothetical protein
MTQKYNDFENFKNALKNQTDLKDELEQKIKNTDSIREKEDLEYDLEELKKNSIRYYSICWDLVNLNDKDLIKEALKKDYILRVIGYFHSINHGNWVADKKSFPYGKIYFTEIASTVLEGEWENPNKHHNYGVQDYLDDMCKYDTFRSTKKGGLMTRDDIFFILDLIPKIINSVIDKEIAKLKQENNQQ